MVTPNDVMLVVLGVNVIWDFGCLGLMIFGCNKLVPHWNLWICTEDRENWAARVLFGMLVLLNAAVRSGSFLWLLAWPAALTYAVEGVLLVGAGMVGLMHARPAIAAGLLSWACMGVMVWCVVGNGN